LEASTAEVNKKVTSRPVIGHCPIKLLAAHAPCPPPKFMPCVYISPVPNFYHFIYEVQLTDLFAPPNTPHLAANQAFWIRHSVPFQTSSQIYADMLEKLLIQVYCSIITNE